MKIKSRWPPGLGAKFLSADYDGNRWTISVAGPEVGACPGCNMRSTRRHSRYIRGLLDLPVQGSLVTVKLHTSRWRCLNDECERQTFSEQLSDIARPYARQTERVAELIRLFGHGVGGRPAERLMKRLGLPTSDDTILRHLKHNVAGGTSGKVRVLGIDEWSWLKGVNYGTIMVDLERREVVDVLPDRSAASTAVWLGQHAEVEIVSRDRCGLYAQGVREGAPQARQVADRLVVSQFEFWRP